MADLTREVLIKIISAYDAGGMDAVSAELKTLNKEAGATGQSMAEASQDAQAMTSVLSGLGSAAGGSTEGIFKIVSGIRSLSGNLLPMIGQIGLLISVFIAAYTATKKIGEALGDAGGQSQKYADKLHNAKEANTEFVGTKMDALKAEWKELIDKISAAADAQNALNAARRSMADAKTASQLADIDLSEKKELSRIPVTDEVGRAKTRAAYQRQRAEVTDSAAIERAKADAAEARQAESSAKQTLDVAEKAAADNSKEIEALQKRYNDLRSELENTKKNPVTKTVKGSLDFETGKVVEDTTVVDTEATQERLASLEAEINRTFKEAYARQKIDPGLRSAASEARGKADVAGINVKAADIRAKTAAKAPRASEADQASETARVAEMERQKKESDAKLASETAEKETYLAMLKKAEDELAAAEAMAKDKNAAVAEREKNLGFARDRVSELKKKYPKELPGSFQGRKIKEGEGNVEGMGRSLEEARAEAAAATANLERVQKAGEKIRGSGTGDASAQAAAAKVWEALRAMAAADMDIAERKGMLDFQEADMLPKARAKAGTKNRDSLAYKPVIEREERIDEQKKDISRAEKTRTDLEQSFAKTMSDFLDVAGGLTRKMASVSAEVQQLKAQQNFGRE